MVLDTEMLSTKNYFESHHIKLSDFWLESCIKWYRDQNSNYTQKELQKKVYEQWLLLDLRDVDLPILPPNLNTSVKFSLTGTYSLQLMYVVDIAKPKYWQMQKIRNSTALLKNDLEQENVVSTNRVLQLVLTDGTQDIKAIEYKYISCLNKKLVPGMKMLIIGPVMVRRGQILLEETNLKLLGGEVEEILVSNAMENVLARYLNLPENPNPRILEDEVIEPLKDIPKVNKTVNRNVNSNSIINKNNFIDEEMRIAKEMEMLLEVENDILTETQRGRNKSPDIFDDVDFEDEEFEKITKLHLSNQKLNHVNETVNERKNDVESTFIDDVFDTEMFDQINLHAELEAINSQEKNAVFFINELKSKSKKGKYRIKAKYNSVIQKLTEMQQSWYLKLKVEDNTGVIDVLMHNDIITELVGCSCTSLMKYKSRIINKDKNAMTNVLKVINNVNITNVLNILNFYVIDIRKF